jgi:hypothetical protein
MGCFGLPAAVRQRPMLCKSSSKQPQAGSSWPCKQLQLAPSLKASLPSTHQAEDVLPDRQQRRLGWPRRRLALAAAVAAARAAARVPAGHREGLEVGLAVWQLRGMGGGSIVGGTHGDSQRECQGKLRASSTFTAQPAPRWRAPRRAPAAARAGR